MISSVVYLQLAAARNLCMALVKSIDLLMAAMEQDQIQHDLGSAMDDSGACVHPLSRRIPLPTMGPKRFKCMDCNEDVLEERQ